MNINNISQGDITKKQYVRRVVYENITNNTDI